MNEQKKYFIAKYISFFKRHILAILLLFIFFVINLKNNTFAHRAMQRCNPPK